MRDEAGDCVLSIKIVPNASSTEVAGWLGDAVKIRVQAPPEKGKANKALIKFLSTRLDCDQKHLEIESGDFAPQKRIRITGISRANVLRQLKLPANR